MKQKILLTICLLFSVGVFAQLTFSKKSDTLLLVDGVENKAKVTISNNTGSDIEYSWTLISNTTLDYENLNPANKWKMQFCDCELCESNEFGPLPTQRNCPFPLSFQPGQNSKEFYLTVDPDGKTKFDAQFIIEVTNITDGIKDTLSYIVLDPTSVTNISPNAQVTSFPNPANELLKVNYSLSNVTAPVVKVYNILGVLVNSYALGNTVGSMNIVTEALQSGMYFFTIESGNERVYIQKFNVMH